MKKWILLPGILLVLASCTPSTTSNSTLTPPSKTMTNIAVIETSKGTIKIELREKEAPLTVANFKKLVGEQFYDRLTFHRYDPGFVIQGGDPNGDGSGGSKDEIQMEIYCTDGSKYVGKTAPRSCEPLLKHTKGAVAMARTPDPNSASSQFYITLKETPFLDREYAVFGYVVEGMDVVEKIRAGDTMTQVKMQ